MDIIEISRVRKAIKRPAFINRVFTELEQKYCDSRGVQGSASYAARFAGKEAVLKAFGTGLSGGSLQDIEIINDSRGCPNVTLRGFYAEMAKQIGVEKIHISLTHSREYAAAQVVFWGGRLNESSNSGGNAED
ncbi:Holo-[acyl-carrier-protein] synthase [bioreactor metagenome]|uniref:Holo-[acyl-carrier-protein] synthase n=1 Tax=bioreactor metagenome TaxID=1076179 RepID=A0A644ZTH3_9ZZZZ